MSLSYVLSSVAQTRHAQTASRTQTARMQLAGLRQSTRVPALGRVARGVPGLSTCLVAPIVDAAGRVRVDCRIRNGRDGRGRVRNPIALW
jgi:hypothetical protein